MAKEWTPVNMTRFDGGVNSTNAITSLAENELEEAENVVPDSRGAIRKKPGFEKFAANNVGAGPITGLYEFKMSDGTYHHIRVRGSKIYTYDSTGDTWTDKTGALTITSNKDAKWRFVSIDDMVFAVNGLASDGVIYWDGGAGNFTPHPHGTCPQTADHIFVWQNRLWFAAVTQSGVFHPMRLMATDLGDPLVVPGSVTDVDGSRGGSRISHCRPDKHNYLYIFCDPTGVYYASWDASAASYSAMISVFNITQEWGVTGDDTVDLIGNIFAFYGSDGRVEGWDHRDLERARRIELSGKHDGFWDDVVFTRERQFVGLKIPELRQFWLAVTSDPAGLIDYNNKVLAIQLYGDIRVDDPEAEDKFSCWPYTGHRINVMSRWRDATGRKRTIFGTDEGEVYTANVGDNYDGEAIRGKFITRYHDADKPGFEKCWRRCAIYCRALGRHEITVSVLDEKKRILKTKQLTLGAGQSYWDQGKWDQMIWDGGGVQRGTFDIDAWSEMAQVKVSNSNADEPFEVLKVILYYESIRELPAGKEDTLGA